jgi:hypothetical protein
MSGVHGLFGSCDTILSKDLSGGIGGPNCVIRIVCLLDHYYHVPPACIRSSADVRLQALKELCMLRRSAKRMACFVVPVVSLCLCTKVAA